MIDLCSLDKVKLLSLTEALTAIEQQIHSITAVETVTLNDACGRILAHTPEAPIDLPQYRNAAMDGYALASRDIDASQSFNLELAGTSWAGKPFNDTLQPGQCLRIFTGAVVPDGLDTVVMQEQTTSNHDTIHFPPGLKACQNIRLPGEDIMHGTALIGAPKKLNAADIGLLASAGITEITVKRRLKIAFFSTGDELNSLGQPLLPGKIYDSNRWMLKNLLNDANFSAVDLGIIPDNKDLLRDTLISAAENHDAIISTGGASVGEADFIKEVLQECGQVGFWKLAIKPGKPLAFGSVGHSYFFGLPGNPVAVIATFQQIIKPALYQLAGAPPVKRLQIQAICQDTLKKNPGRIEFMRGILYQTDTGEFYVKSAGRQGSHILSSMSRSNCYIVLPALNGGVKSGDVVTVEPFDIELTI